MANGLLAGIGAGLTAGTQSFQDARRLRMAQEQALRDEESKKRALAIDAAKSGLRFDEQGNVQRDQSLIIEDPLKKEREQLEVEKLRKEVSGTGLINPKDKIELEILGLKRDQARADLQTKQTARPKPTVAQQSIDRAFAKTYDEMVIKGGEGRVQSNIDKLREQANRLRNMKSISPLERLAIGTPIAGPVLAKELTDIKENIDSVTIEDLRQTMGAQFTEREGAEFKNLGFNPQLPPEEQARRIERKAEIIENALNRTRQLIGAFENNDGTLAGIRRDQLGDLRPDEKSKKISATGLLENTTRGNEAKPLQAQQKNDAIKESGRDPDVAKYAAQYGLEYNQALQIIENRKRGQAR